MWNDDRPLGVSLVSILSWLHGGWALVMGVLSIVLNPLSILSMTPIVAIVSGLTCIVAGFGLWAMQSWGWRTAIFLNIFGLILGFISFSIPWLIVHGLVLAYLFSVRQAFDQH